MTLTEWIKEYKNFDFTADQIENSKCPSFDKACNQLKNILNKQLKKDGYEIVNFNPNWYECSFFIKSSHASDKSKYCYVSFGDVRHTDNWHKDVLIRTAEHEKDFHGGMNNKCELINLVKATESVCKNGHYNSWAINR